MVALISFMKERVITVVLTSTAVLGVGGDPTLDTLIAPMTDVILVMRYVESEGEPHRALLVLKMRGSEHEKRVREYRITSSGLSIEGPMERVAGFKPGAAVTSRESGG